MHQVSAPTRCGSCRRLCERRHSRVDHPCARRPSDRTVAVIAQGSLRRPLRLPDRLPAEPADDDLPKRGTHVPRAASAVPGRRERKVHRRYQGGRGGEPHLSLSDGPSGPIERSIPGRPGRPPSAAGGGQPVVLLFGRREQRAHPRQAGRRSRARGAATPLSSARQPPAPSSRSRVAPRQPREPTCASRSCSLAGPAACHETRPRSESAPPSSDHERKGRSGLR